MRVLITGARGFVGPYVSEALHGVCGSGLVVVATSKDGGAHPVFGQVEALDVTDKVAVQDAVARHRPTHVVHLAAVAALGAAQADPQNTWRIHVQGALNVAHAVLDKAPGCWMIHVGSGLVYGESAKTGQPLDESALLAPIDDYAVTKAAADLALGALSRQGLKCIRLRPFNHTGPGQTEAFVVPAFAMQIARIEAGLAPPVIRVGNLDAQRDFLDARDVASAYAQVALNSDDLAPNTIFNVASGISWRMGDILDRLLAQSRVKIVTEQDSQRLRPSDLPRIVGDANRIRTQLGWAPRHLFEETLVAVLKDCRARVAQG
ncbi:MAG: NAD-dependent epimerase/dehydratase family protein [Mesorhizobium sp.]|nr:NAD-dependent epimerase/dehydratase family protein [bacterium M00.F.Ca.ET.205.01.1.1]TGU51009.1 NAD-dependent epimerase/dehydratase family protein [bacterium M00.F.Ca.ET.152.01.1.1]TGV34499.1 NAD-dependent epimerase/dehydratase family protein [Mesorhizobium sp. M00.F.Ca.ET.186.01.1.1]TGZ41833.1 NAD-dependent epimerase/dehydratase family protein [bacterium M00.F.Ca.ET.162.01.1.1]TIW62622.1 MAG: NAD-dependent epimerase/dehydratase family protein [Mesorhizobium sp.]